MRISNELLACYLDDTVTAEERNLVREYLCDHPDEYDRVLRLMDDDTEDYLEEQEDLEFERYNALTDNHNDYCCNLELSAAAFAPQFKIKSKQHLTTDIDDMAILSRLDNMWDELNNN